MEIYSINPDKGDRVIPNPQIKGEEDGTLLGSQFRRSI
jgi:hypothetical protein